MSNEKWHLMYYNEWGVNKQLVNRKKNYTMLVNEVTKEYVVAYAYDSNDNTWGQGHYFHDFYEALDFLFL